MAMKLTCEEGHSFRKIGTHKVELMRGNGGAGATGTTMTCGCDKAGGCKVSIEGTTATCLEDGCKGSCTWTIHVPGLSGVFTLLKEK
jgi:hypothetical protein